ncbi:cytochrome P450 2J2-like [Acanthaster planci]|uniref:Cytochrome P450 2J2-like n=1 Tax=Acanthaster planci TaxID=133434 RepID=A0A8B7ZR93_ACAPL|nr:cytochrome P450 2J2-like [Acanthaster planci]
MEALSAWRVLDARSLLLGTVVLLVSYRFLRRPRNLPPGPWGWPILGHLPHMMASRDGIFKLFARLTTRYGDVVRINLVGVPMVILKGLDRTKEAFSQYQFSGHPPLLLTQSIAPGAGLFGSSGEQWKEIRRFCMTVLRKLGVGKSRFEQDISTEAQILVDELKNFNGKAFDPKHLFGNAVSNVICTVVLGKRFQYADPTFKHLLKVLNNLVSDKAGVEDIFEMMPVFAKLKMLPLVRNYVNAIESFFRHINLLLKEHRKRQNIDDPQDFIDIFLNEKETKERQGTKSSVLLPENLKRIVGDLFAAGSETTATTLRWGMLYMMAHPEIQRRVQKELDDVTSRNRLPRISDKPELPYTEAVLCEIQRIGTIVPVHVHMSSEDTTIAGYNIPKGTIVATSIWQIHYDPLVWEEPEEFRPERFLNQDGKFRPRLEFIPFGIGRRICLGEHLAKMELFIFFTHLLHHFTLKKPDHVPVVSFEGIHGVVWAPKSFEVSAIARE